MDLAVLHGLYIPCAQTGLYIHHVIESLIQRLLQHRERANVFWAEEAPVLVRQEFGKRGSDHAGLCGQAWGGL